MNVFVAIAPACATGKFEGLYFNAAIAPARFALYLLVETPYAASACLADSYFHPALIELTSFFLQTIQLQHIVFLQDVLT